MEDPRKNSTIDEPMTEENKPIDLNIVFGSLDLTLLGSIYWHIISFTLFCLYLSMVSFSISYFVIQAIKLWRDL